MKTVKIIVNTNGLKYPIIIGTGIINKISKILDDSSIKFKKCLLVVDNKISKNYIKKLLIPYLKKKLIIFFLKLVKKIKIN